MGGPDVRDVGLENHTAYYSISARIQIAHRPQLSPRRQIKAEFLVDFSAHGLKRSFARLNDTAEYPPRPGGRDARYVVAMLQHIPSAYEENRDHVVKWRRWDARPIRGIHPRSRVSLLSD